MRTFDDEQHSLLTNQNLTYAFKQARALTTEKWIRPNNRTRAPYWRRPLHNSTPHICTQWPSRIALHCMLTVVNARTHTNAITWTSSVLSFSRIASHSTHANQQTFTPLTHTRNIVVTQSTHQRRKRNVTNKKNQQPVSFLSAAGKDVFPKIRRSTALVRSLSTHTKLNSDSSDSTITSNSPPH